jgi:uncharacterized protein YkwD
MFRRPSRSPLALAIVFALASGVSLATPRPALAWSTGTYSSTSEKALIAMTNRSRAAAGLRSLRVDSTLTSVARWRSKDMIDRDYFSHTIPGYGTVFKKLDSKGYCYKLAGENIGWNTYPDDEATAAIHQMFMDSPSHRANILGKAWDVIGVGAYKGPGGKKMWTVLFADKCGSTASSKPKPAATSTPHPTPRPTPKPKPTPRPTAAPTPTPTPTPAPLATSPLAGLESDGNGRGLGPGGQGDGNGNGNDKGNGGSAGNGPPPGQGGPGHGLRVVESSTTSGLVDTIVGGVASLFFGA